MSVVNNSLRTIDGQNTLVCDTIEISEEIVLDGDNGSDGAVIKSDGINARWSLLSDLLTAGTGISIVGTTISTSAVPNSALQNSTISGIALGNNLNNLIAGTNVNFVSSGGDILTTYNGNTETTIITANTEYTAGLGLELSTLTFNAKTDEDTITRTHNVDTLKVLKVPNALTASSPLTLTGGYDGSSAKSITISNIANSDLQNSTISGIALGGSLNALTASSPLTLTGGYDGSSAKSISISNIPNSALQNSTISGKALGTNLANLTAGTNISFSSGTTYNGSTGITINGLDRPYALIDYEDSEYYLHFGVENAHHTISGEHIVHTIGSSSGIDGFFSFSQDSLVFSLKIPVGWEATKVKVGLFEDDGAGGYQEAPDASGGGTDMVYIGTKNKLSVSDTPSYEQFAQNSEHTLTTSLTNSHTQFTNVEIFGSISSTHYTAGGYLVLTKSS